MPNDQQLRQEIAALQHELRRTQDGLERNPTHDLEQRKQLLVQNIALCERQLQPSTLNQNRKDQRTQ